MTACPTCQRAGIMHDPETGPAPTWGGRRAGQWTRATLTEFGDRCCICRRPGADSADHIIPRALGGAVYALDNLHPAHRSCNYSRGKRALTDPGVRVEDGRRFFS